MKEKVLMSLCIGLLFINFNIHAQELWGMTWNGGGTSGDKGVIFSFDLSTNTYTNKLLFDGINTGRKPMGGLLLATNGNLYGMTFYGGTADKGVLFKFDPTSNILTKLIDFDGTNGAFPEGSLFQATDGNLYGLTIGGGVSNKGVMFKYNLTTDSFTKLVTFDGTNGAFPKGSLFQASNGLLYGTTNKGGAQDYGVIFSYDISTNTYQAIKTFDGLTSGGYPNAGLMQASNGKLYGLTSSDVGTAIEILYEYNTSTNLFSKKAEFTGLNGATPTGDLIEVSGKLYGLTFAGGTSQGGTLFQYDLTTGVLTKEIDFTLNGMDGYYPSGTLTHASNGKIYGTASQGGQNQYGSFNDSGVIFNYDPATNTYTNLYNFDGSFSGAGHGPLGNLIEVVIPETITINDTNFEQALIDLEFDSNGLNGNILKTDAERVVSLDVSNPLTNPLLPNVGVKISDLTGIEGFINLQTLNSSGNSLTSVNLSHNTLLTSLDASLNALTGIDVSHNTALQILKINTNSMVNLDISLNTQLQNLDVSNNTLERVNLKNNHNTSMTTFDIRNNPSLSCIMVDDVAYSNANWLNKDTAANYNLNCDDTWTVYMPEAGLLSNLLGISGLDLNTDGFITLAEAAAFTGTLDLSGLGITDPTGLEAFTGITQLNISGNNISDLSSLINSSVIVVSSKINGNLSFKTRNFNGLTSLNASYNNLTSLDVSAMASLIDLDVSHNLLTNLNIRNGNNLNLINLNALSNNSLSCIQADDIVLGFIPLGWQVDNTATFSANCSATLSVDVSKLYSLIKIYPNPASEKLNLIMPQSIIPNKIQLFNSIGLLIKQFKSSQKELNLKSLATGLYVLKIWTNKGNINQKIIKE